MTFQQIMIHPYVQQVGLWILLGLATGVGAKLLLPGSENMGWIRTILFGLAGSLIGNQLAPYFLKWPQYNPMSLPGFAMGMLGALVLVILNRLVTKS